MYKMYLIFFLFDNFDVLALILSKYVACSCNQYCYVLKKDTTISGVQHKNFKIWENKCFLKKIYTPKLKEK